MADEARTRFKGEYPKVYVRGDTWSYKYVGQAANTIVTTHSQADGGDYKATSDVTHPGFAKRIKRGEYINSPFSSSESKLYCPPGHTVTHESKPANVEYWSRTGSANWTQVNLTSRGGPVYTSPISGVESMDSLKLKAIGNMDPAGSRLMEDVIQIRQTLSSLRNPLRGLDDAISLAARGNPLLSFSQLWLKYRMEWLPLVGSASGLAKALIKPTKVLQSGVLLRSAASASGAGSISGSAWNSSNSEFYNYSDSSTINRKAICHYRVRMPVSGIPRDLGLRLKDVPEGVWNALPYTFLIDRVVNISHVVRALSAMSDPNIIVVGGCIVEEVVSTKSIQLTRQKYDTYYTVATGPVDTESHTKTRIPWYPSLTQIPSLVSIKPKGLIDDAVKATDVCAMILQRISRI